MTWVQFLVQEDPLAKGMATHSSILVWRIPWTEDPGSLHSIGLQRAGHNWTASITRAFLFFKAVIFCNIYRNNACMLSHSVMPDSCNPMVCSPLGSSVHGVFQARILEWVAISFLRGSSQPRDQRHVSYVSCNSIGRQVLYH